MPELTQEQAKYVQQRALGYKVATAARMVGVAAPTAYNWERKTAIQCAIADAIAQKDSVEQATESMNSVVLTSANRVTQQAITTCAPEIVEYGRQHALDLYKTIVDLGLGARSEKVRLDAAERALEIMGLLQRVTSFEQKSIATVGLNKDDIMQIRRHVLGVPDDTIEVNEVSSTKEVAGVSTDTNGSTDASV